MQRWGINRKNYSFLDFFASSIRLILTRVVKYVCVEVKLVIDRLTVTGGKQTYAENKPDEVEEWHPELFVKSHVTNER